MQYKSLKASRTQADLNKVDLFQSSVALIPRTLALQRQAVIIWRRASSKSHDTWSTHTRSRDILSRRTQFRTYLYICERRYYFFPSVYFRAASSFWGFFHTHRFSHNQQQFYALFDELYSCILIMNVLPKH